MNIKLFLCVSHVFNFKSLQFISIICYILPHYWHAVMIYNWYKKIWWSRNTYPGDTTPYFALLYKITFSASTCAMMHTIIFHKKTYLKYINFLSRILNTYKNCKSNCEPGKVQYTYDYLKH